MKRNWACEVTDVSRSGEMSAVYAKYRVLIGFNLLVCGARAGTL